MRVRVDAAPARGRRSTIPNYHGTRRMRREAGGERRYRQPVGRLARRSSVCPVTTAPALDSWLAALRCTRPHCPMPAGPRYGPLRHSIFSGCGRFAVYFFLHVKQYYYLFDFSLTLGGALFPIIRLPSICAARRPVRLGPGKWIESFSSSFVCLIVWFTIPLPFLLWASLTWPKSTDIKFPRTWLLSENESKGFKTIF